MTPVCRALMLFLALAGAAGCGSNSDERAETTSAAETVSAADVESRLRTELSQGGSGIVDLEREPPNKVTCEKDAGSPSGWRCTVTPSTSGESYLCIVEVDPQTKQTTKTTCGRIEN
jgi:hypothetical protein